MAKEFKFDSPNLDANESAYASRQLEQTRAKTYDKVYGHLKARRFLPVDNSIHPGAETVRYLQYDMFGTAIIIATGATDLPRADVAVAEFWMPIRSLGTSYGYFLQELRAGALSGVPLDAKKAESARRAMEQQIDLIARSGDSANDLTGFLGLSNTTTYTVANGSASGDTEWGGKTPDEIVADMCGMIQAVKVASKETFEANALLLPVTSMGTVRHTRMGDGSSLTILQHFQAIYPNVSVDEWDALETAGSGSVKRAVAYAKDPDVLVLVIPQEFEQLAPQERGLEVVTPCHARCGGVQCFYPFAVCYADGI